MAKKLLLTDLLSPFIQKESVLLTLNGEEYEYEFGMRPPSDQFDYAQIEVLEKIQEELGWTDEQMDEYTEKRNSISQKVGAKVDKLLKEFEKPTPEQRIETRTRVRIEDFPYTITDTKYNMRWNKYIIPLQIRYLVVDVQSGEPIFDCDEKILNLPREQREAISEKLDAYLLKRAMGAPEAKK